MNSQADIRVSGYVQGVGFRYFVYSQAQKLGLKGYVRNEPDGSVTIEVAGERDLIEKFIGEVRKGPRHAGVEGVDVRWKDDLSGFTHFEIR